MSKKHPPTLYHISFQEAKDDIWTPTAPASNGSKSTYPEPETNRICCSESLEGCFMAVYPNVSVYFEDKKYKYPHMDFYYYTPVIPTNIRDKELLAPEELTDKRYVWDAHLTREWNILIPVRMVLAGKVRYFNTTKDSEWVTTHAFNDPDEAVVTVCPPVKLQRLPYYFKPKTSDW